MKANKSESVVDTQSRGVPAPTPANAEVCIIMRLVLSADWGIIKPKSSSLGYTERRVDTNRMQVLIAESETAVSRLLGVLMRREGHEAQVVEDGADALQVARDTRPDLVVMDAVLPGMNGQELVDQFETDPETASIPLVVLGTQEELDELDVNGFATLTKPFALPQLHAAIEHAVSVRLAGATS